MKTMNAIVTGIRFKDIRGEDSFYIRIEDGKGKNVLLKSGEANVKRLEEMGMGQEKEMKIDDDLGQTPMNLPLKSEKTTGNAMGNKK